MEQGLNTYVFVKQNERLSIQPGLVLGSGGRGG